MEYTNDASRYLLQIHSIRIHSEHSSVMYSSVMYMETFRSSYKYYTLTLSQATNFRHCQTERVCRQQFQISNENGRKFSKWVENTLEKKEIAYHEQFLLIPHCF